MNKSWGNMQKAAPQPEGQSGAHQPRLRRRAGDVGNAAGERERGGREDAHLLRASAE
jgi:hypothetical protein